MEAEKTYRNKVARIIQQKRGGKSALEFADNRQNRMLQALAEPVQRLEDEDEMLQGSSKILYKGRRTKPNFCKASSSNRHNAWAMKKMMNLCRKI